MYLSSCQRLLNNLSPSFSTSLPLYHLGGHHHFHGPHDEHDHIEKEDERTRTYFVPSDMSSEKFIRVNYSDEEFKRRTGKQTQEIEDIYKGLARRWGDGFITSHPTKHKSFEQLMKIMFTPEDAKFVSRIPTTPISVGKLVKKFNYGLTNENAKMWEKGFTIDEINARIDKLASNGLLYDFYVTKKGLFGYEKRERYVAFPDYILGWYEFYWMRIQQTGELPPKEIANLLEVYQTQTGYYDELYKGEVPYFRTFVREDALPEEELVQIYDYESVSEIIEKADTLCVGGCGCRLHMKSVGEDIGEYPTNACFSFNKTAENLLRNGMAKTISRSEAREIIEHCKSLGMCETGDNLKMPNFLCHCEKKYCSVFGAMNRFGKKSFIPSNYIAVVSNVTNCISCGKCVQNCPVNAIKLTKMEIEEEKEEEEFKDLGKKVTDEVKNEQKKRKAKKGKKRVPVINSEKCLGCGVCVTVCEPTQHGIKFKQDNERVIKMERRPKEKQVIVPDNFLERTIRMAVERKRLHKLLFADPEKMSHRVLGKIAKVIEESKPAEALLAIEPLDSIFLNVVCKVASVTHGKIFANI